MQLMLRGHALRSTFRWRLPKAYEVEEVQWELKTGRNKSVGRCA